MNEIIIENLKRIDKHLCEHSKKIEELKEIVVSQKYICEKKFVKKPNLIVIYAGITAIASVVSIIINRIF